MTADARPLARTPGAAPAASPACSRRCGARTARRAQRHGLPPPGWIVIFSGVFEPLFYLLGIGSALGTLIGDVTLADGRQHLLRRLRGAGAAGQGGMNGAIAESIFNVFFKLNFSKTYDAHPGHAAGDPRDRGGRDALVALPRDALRGRVRAGHDRHGAGHLTVPLPGDPGLDPHRRILQRGLPGDHCLPAHGAGLRPADGPGGDADVPVQRHVLPDQLLPAADPARRWS